MAIDCPNAEPRYDVLLGESRMSESQINGNIAEIDGAHYPVKLQWVPKVGELIKLTSFIDVASKDEPVHTYEVVAVRHDMYDVTDKLPGASDGHHFVSVFVKPSGNSLSTSS